MIPKSFNNCFASSAYYRLALSSLLPNINRIIYTDIDSVNLKDLTEMYNIQFEKDMYICDVLYKITMLFVLFRQCYSYMV